MRFAAIVCDPKSIGVSVLKKLHLGQIYLGIDPGLTGAIVAILPDGIEFHDMPVLTQKKKQTLDYAGLAHILRRYVTRGDVYATIELVGAMPGQGVSSMFKFGQCYGAVLATLATLQIPYQTVTPSVWKSAYRLIGCEKDASRTRALEMFPATAEHLTLKKHHGRADALLIADYGGRQSQRKSDAVTVVEASINAVN